MSFACYLAMTAAELSACSVLPPNPAWMACHFSAYGNGLSNFPAGLPEGAMVILNDRTPVHGHDPETVAQQLKQAVEEAKAERVLLDLQRPDCEGTAAIVQAVLSALPCPAAVTELYGGGLTCPLFLPPPPPHIPLPQYLAPWHGREIWLEISSGSEMVTVTENGSTVDESDAEPPLFQSEILHCHYKTELLDDAAVFHFSRTAEDIQALQEEAKALGVACTVGLYQELHSL